MTSAYKLHGWKKSPRDERDKLRMAPAVPLPDEVDNRRFIVSVRDQDGLGECTGFGIMGSLTAEALIDKASSEWFSPDWGYAGARLLEGTLDKDEGAYSRSVYKFIAQYGCLLERYHPFDSELDTTDPRTWPNSEQALKWKIDQYVRCVDGAMGICAALADGHIVTLGAPWFEAWSRVGPTGRMSDYPGPCVGGHQTYLVGYSIPKQYFILVNSWGRSWGQDGIGFLPFSTINLFKQNGGYDAFYAVTSWEPGQQPEPLPDPKIPAWLPIVLIGGAIIGLLILIL